MIKVTLNEESKATKEKLFPKLMSSEKGMIVFFYKERRGTCIINSGALTNVGEYSENWSMSIFTDYNEPITLQNL